MGGERARGHLDLLLLGVLAGGPLHGYRVIARLRERSGGTFDLPEGTVYPALHRLEAEGMLRSWWAELDGRRRRLYELTGAGARALSGGRDEWRRFAAGVERVLEARA
jgi:DNA-binding PadR family transcriptional regulator